MLYIFVVDRVTVLVIELQHVEYYCIFPQLLSFILGVDYVPGKVWRLIKVTPLHRNMRIAMPSPAAADALKEKINALNLNINNMDYGYLRPDGK